MKKEPWQSHMPGITPAGTADSETPYRHVVEKLNASRHAGLSGKTSASNGPASIHLAAALKQLACLNMSGVLAVSLRQL